VRVKVQTGTTRRQVLGSRNVKRAQDVKLARGPITTAIEVLASALIIFWFALLYHDFAQLLNRRDDL